MSDDGNRCAIVVSRDTTIDGGATTDTFNPLEMNGADHPTMSILSSYDTLTEGAQPGAHITNHIVRAANNFNAG